MASNKPKQKNQPQAEVSAGGAPTGQQSQTHGKPTAHRPQQQLTGAAKLAHERRQNQLHGTTGNQPERYFADREVTCMGIVTDALSMVRDNPQCLERVLRYAQDRVSEWQQESGQGQGNAIGAAIGIAGGGERTLGTFPAET